MKVLLFIDSLTGAGAQRQLVNLALGLDGRGHDVTLATYAPKDFFLSRLDGSGVAYLNFQKAYRFDPMPVWRLLRTVDRVAPDVLIAFLRTPSVYAEMVKVLRPSLPLVVSERAGVDAGGLTRGDRAAGTLHRLATRVTGNSHGYLGRLVEARPALASRTEVIYNGVDDVFFENGRRRGEGPLGEGDGTGDGHGEGGDGQRPIRLCVVAARATRQKAPLVMARAVAKLSRRELPPFTLEWIGPVDEGIALVRETVDEIARHRLDDIWRWVGPVKDVVARYPDYDALVSPSLYEGVANTVCEAMASGLPVIVTDIADNARILADGGGGLICPPDDAGALADALQDFLSLSGRERVAMGRRAHARASEQFSMTRFVDRWEGLCHRLVRESRA